MSAVQQQSNIHLNFEVFVLPMYDNIPFDMLDWYYIQLACFISPHTLSNKAAFCLSQTTCVCVCVCVCQCDCYFCDRDVFARYAGWAIWNIAWDQIHVENRNLNIQKHFQAITTLAAHGWKTITIHLAHYLTTEYVCVCVFLFALFVCFLFIGFCFKHLRMLVKNNSP